VAIDPKMENSPGTLEAVAAPNASAIENELPTYRAVSPHAVLALVCGLLAVFSFAHFSFLLFAAAAIVLGFVADRKIARMPEVLTGRFLAQAGIALALIFGLSAITLTLVQDRIRMREAEKFARHYAQVLTKGTYEDALWYGRDPNSRRGMTPQELAAETARFMTGPQKLDAENSPLKKLVERLKEIQGEVDFIKIEKQGQDKLDSFATALYEIHPAADKSIDEAERYVLVYFKGWNTNRRYEWWAEQVVFPAQPDTFTPPAAAVDDGHGHAH
jgi:hypothetical protein